MAPAQQKFQIGFAISGESSQSMLGLSGIEAKLREVEPTSCMVQWLNLQPNGQDMDRSPSKLLSSETMQEAKRNWVLRA